MSMHGDGQTCVPTHDEDHESADRLVAATDDRKLWRFGHGPFPGGLVHRFERPGRPAS